MVTVAILGATGQTGQAILTLLLKDPSIVIHCFVRSASKLHKQTPELKGNEKVKIFESSLNDIPTLAECLAPCHAVFSCIATNENIPGCSIALDTAHSVVAALSHIRSADNASTALPRIVVLSSATINDHLCREIPRLARWFLRTGLRYIYNDLERAEAYYRMHSSWMTAIFMQPGGLVQDKQVGHEVSTEREQSWLSYLDLAAGMVECGLKDREDTEWDWMGVSVVPTGKTRFNFVAPFHILRAWVWSVLPPLYWPFHWAGLV